LLGHAFAIAVAVLVFAVAAAGCAPARDDAPEALADAARCLPLAPTLDLDHAREAADLLERWAPTLVQHVARRDRGRDRPTRVDFDDDWDATNNWANQRRLKHQLPPAVYGAAVLTETHAYLTYTLYYPRDWTRPLCLPYICHDNDLESLLLIIDRMGDSRTGDSGRAGDSLGELVLVETKAHMNYAALRGDEVARDARGRPLIRIEAQGHGPWACRPDEHACRPGNGRLVYVRGAPPSSPPRQADGREVHYELLSLRETLWARRHLHEESLSLWTAGETGPMHYAGARCGRMGHTMGASMAWSRYPGGVRPPWALRGQHGARGDWFLDPAAARVPSTPELAARGPGALRYVHHPFLNDLARECVGARCAHPEPPPEPSRASSWAGMGVIAGLMMLALLRSMARLSRAGAAWPYDARRPGR
jgi:hypothetical protein